MPKVKSKKSGGSPLLIILAVVGVVFGIGALVCGGILLMVLLPAVQGARSAAQTAQAKNNLKQIGLAMHNYHDMNRTLPFGGTFSETGEGQHGWMTAILPYVEQGPLHARIDMNESWNSAKNQPVFRVVVPVFLHPGHPSNPMTPEGYGAAHFAGNSLLLGKNKQFSFREVNDGLSNTAMAGEVAANFSAWGAPDNTRDLSLGFGTGPAQFGGSGNRIVLLMGDGAVRVVDPSVDISILKMIATPDGGEVVPDF